MDAATLQTKVNYGYGKAATVLGSAYSQYRASGADNPTAAGNLVGSPKAWLTTDAALKGSAQPQYGKPVWYAAIDRSSLASGDYLVGPAGTFFVSSVDYPAPVSLSWCNRTITVKRPELGVTVAGASSVYSGDTSQPQSDVMTNWPASELQLSSGSSGRDTGMGLPTDVRLPLTAFLLPTTAPLAQFQDILTDDLGRTFYLQMVESSPLGYRLTAQQVAI